MICRRRNFCICLTVCLMLPGLSASGQLGGNEGKVLKSSEGCLNSLIEAITTIVAPDSWDRVGGPGAIQPLDSFGLILVSQTTRVHERIDHLIAAVRRARQQQEPPAEDAPGNRPDNGSMIVDSTANSIARERIEAALDSKADLELIDVPLRDVASLLADKYQIPVVIDARALEDYGIGTDTPITMALRGISLRSALRLMLREMDLTYLIADEVMQITTVEEAESRLITRVYMVKDLANP